MNARQRPAARRRSSLGGVEQTRQAYRERQTLPWLETLGQDLRFGLRMLQKSPGFTAIAIVTLALGIGANTAIFSIVNGVLLNPLPFPHPEQLVVLHASKPNFEFGSVSYPNFQDWRKDNHTFSSMAISRGYYFSLTGMGAAEQLDGQFMTSGFFETLGVKPLLGRTFTLGGRAAWRGASRPDQRGPVAAEVRGVPRCAGQEHLTLEGRNFTIIGVIPASFQLSVWSLRSRDIYVPIGQWRNTGLNDRGAGLGIRGIARLKPGVTLEQANADMARVSQNLAIAFPDVDKGTTAKLVPLKEQIVGDVRPFLLVLMARCRICVADRLRQRRRFTARAVHGADEGVRRPHRARREPRRLVCQLLTESLMLARRGRRTWNALRAVGHPCRAEASARDIATRERNRPRPPCSALHYRRSRFCRARSLVSFRRSSPHKPILRPHSKKVDVARAESAIVRKTSLSSRRWRWPWSSRRRRADGA